MEMKIEKEFWEVALYFVGFEFIYWNFGDYLMGFMRDFYNGRYISFDWRIFFSLISIIISIWFFKQFIKHLIALLNKISMWRWLEP